MINFKSPQVLLSLITILAIGLRFWQLDTLPSQLNRDEAALGYNAFLLVQTGQDEWGKPWPLVLESFGDYKLPGYVWLVAIAGQIFGWHDWVVRLPSAAAGSLLPGLIYIWLKNLKKADSAALWAALLTAVLPVSWFYSRMGFEANLALSFLVIWLILVAKKATSYSQVWLDVGLIFGAALLILTYNTPLLLLPFILIYLPWLWGFENWKNWWRTWLWLLVITGSGFYGLATLFGQKSAITLFSDPSVWNNFVTQRQAARGILTHLTSNWYVYLAEQILWRWWRTWSPEFLVLRGGTHPWHALPGAGHIFWIHYVFGISGFLVLGLGKICNQLTKLKDCLRLPEIWLAFLTIISLIPAMITIDAPHATRSLLFLVLLAVWAGLMIDWFLNRFQSYKKIILGLIGLILILEIGRYGLNYFKSFPNQQDVFQPGLNQVIQTLDRDYPQTPIAVVGDGYAYVLWAWYSQLSPRDFFATVIKQLPDRIGFRYGQQVGRYHFIMQAADRDESEKILVEWQNSSWQIKTF
ncbi:MAG TPA: hypothetical protein DEP87_00135 [Candidatus Pacebacteria bacterium]|nr:hypothetical protein [Candidatus Paceibacterota bacterium]